MSQEEVREKLEALVEDLADLALDALRQRDEASERRLSRARRAVVKAAHLLDDPNSEPDDF